MSVPERAPASLQCKPSQQPTTAIRQAEVLAAKRMIERERFDLYPARLLSDSARVAGFAFRARGLNLQKMTQ
jgi:hypothetical protein